MVVDAVVSRRLLLCIAGLACFLGAWVAFHPAIPLDANGDVYDSLSAARNLLEGRGLRHDVIYPLTTAFAWGRALPQPMLERPPGLALLLAPALALTRGDPTLAPRAVRVVQIALLGVTVLVGLLGLQARRAGAAAAAWLLLLLLSPQLGLAASWGWVEVPCGLLLLVLWLRLRERDPCVAGAGAFRAAIVDGACAGLLTLLRTDLIWVPLLWWLFAALRSPRFRGEARTAGRHLALSVGAWLLLTLPWWIHVTRVAGSPLFNPLSYALQLDLSQGQWDYQRLRGLVAVPMLENLRDNFVPALVKVRHGVRFFAETLGRWLPWAVWAVALLLVAERWRRLRRGAASPAVGPVVLLGATVAGAVLVYAFVSQEVRHLLVLLPALSWEIALLVERRAAGVLQSPWARGLVLAAGAGLAILIAPPRLVQARAQVELARSQAPLVAVLAREVATWPPGPIFTDNSAVCWLTRRTGVWSPYDTQVEQTVRETVPGMREARWARIP